MEFDTEYVAFLETPNLAWIIQSTSNCALHNIEIEGETIISDFPYEESFEDGMGMWLIQSKHEMKFLISLRCWKIFNLDPRNSFSSLHRWMCRR